MRVIRTMPDDGWVPISNAAARDHKLSWRARGLLVELLSYPDGWETTVDRLVAQARKHGEVSEGRAAMRKAIAELADAGYITYERTQDRRGHWQTDMIVSDSPNREGADRRTKNRTVGIPAPRKADTSETGTSVDWSILNKKDTKTVTKTDLQTRSDEDSPPLTSFASRADARSQNDHEKPTLDEAYARVNRMPEGMRQHALLDLECHRPEIYRKARRGAIAQFKKESPGVFREDGSYEQVDCLSLKYAVQHYFPDLPTWLAKPLGLFPVSS